MYIVIFIILGLLMGSFLTVVGLRLPKQENFVNDRSKCPHCKHTLSALELIPIISFITLKGKCKNCHHKISLIYPLMEILCASLYLVSYLVFGFNSNLIIALTISSAFIVICVSDIKYNIIPDSILLISALIILITTFISQGLNALLYSLLSAGLLFGFMFLMKLLGNFLFKKESLGDGDIKLMALMGLMLHPLIGMVGIVLASMLALPYAIIILKTKKNHEIFFGPFLMASCVFLFFLQIDANFIIDLITIKI